MISKNAVAFSIAIIIVLCCISCNSIDADGLWENATYRKDTTVGEGAKEVKLDVVIGEQSITITLKTDGELLGTAMYEEGLINNAEFFDTLNGIKADWNAGNVYWAFYEGDTAMSCGVNDVTLSGGEHYRFVYTK